MKIKDIFTTRLVTGRYRIVCALATLVAVAVWFLLPWPIALVVSAISGYVAAEFAWAALVFPQPWERRRIITEFEVLTMWWDDISRPAIAGEFDGKPALVRHVWADITEYYSPRGKYLGSIQTINWSDLDLDWRPGQPEDIEMLVSKAEPNDKRRLAPIAWLRSDRIAA